MFQRFEKNLRRYVVGEISDDAYLAGEAPGQVETKKICMNDSFFQGGKLMVQPAGGFLIDINDGGVESFVFQEQFRRTSHSGADFQHMVVLTIRLQTCDHLQSDLSIGTHTLSQIIFWTYWPFNF